MKYNKIFEQLQEINTEFIEEHITEFHQYSSDPKMYEYMCELTPHQNLSETKTYFKKLVNDESNFVFPILKEKKVIGSVTLREENKYRGYFSIGYASSTLHAGEIIIPLTISAVIWLSFEKYKAYRLQGISEINNLRTQKLIEGLGFKEEGILRSYYKNKSNGNYIDAKIHSLFKNEFRHLKFFKN